MKRVIPLLLLIAVLALSCSNGTYTFCTVSFETDGGTEVPAQEVIRGRKAVEPKSPEKDGCKFLCWKLGDEKYDFSTAVEKDITLTAVYTADDTFCTVIFETDGGTPVSSQEVYKGKTAVEPKSPEKNGFTFLYWTLEGGKQYDFNTKVENDITLIAKYQDDSTIEKIVTEAKRIYTIADILVNKTTFSSGTTDATKAFSSTDDAALLLATALNIEKDQLYVDINNKQVVYSSSVYGFELNEATLAANNSSVADGGTLKIELEKLYLEGRYTDGQTILSIDKKEITFNSVSIEWKNDGTEITGTVELKVNNIPYYTLTFTSNDTGMTKATYGGIDITSKL